MISSLLRYIVSFPETSGDIIIKSTVVFGRQMAGYRTWTQRYPRYNNILAGTRGIVMAEFDCTWTTKNHQFANRRQFVDRELGLVCAAVTTNGEMAVLVNHVTWICTDIRQLRYLYYALNGPSMQKSIEVWNRRKVYKLQKRATNLICRVNESYYKM